MYIGVLISYGLGTLLMCFITRDTPFAFLLLYGALCGACCGALMALAGALPAELLGPTEQRLLPHASSLGFSCLGVGVLVGPAVGGWLYDVSGDYVRSFGFAAAALWLGGLLLAAPLRCCGGVAAEPPGRP